MNLTANQDDLVVAVLCQVNAAVASALRVDFGDRLPDLAVLVERCLVGVGDPAVRRAVWTRAGLDPDQQADPDEWQVAV